MDKKIRVGILGATGSIGRQTAEVISASPDVFEVALLSAYNDFDGLSKLIDLFKPKIAVCRAANTEKIGNTSVYSGVSALDNPEIYSSCDVVINGIGGFAGLTPALAVLESNATLATANKESIVSAGEIMNNLAKKHNKRIIPVDSEHSAVFQCLEDGARAEKIILTASGGAFRDKEKSELIKVTAAEALNHPTWKMGKKVTVDSATLMNKGLEIIEAKHLFGDLPVETVIHRESIIHAMVEFADGSVKALLSYPDMRLPIQYALTYPQRLAVKSGKLLNFAKIGTLNFAEPDRERFPCLAIGEYVADNPRLGVVLTAADEVAVDRFITGKLGFYGIPKLIEDALSRFSSVNPQTAEDVVRIEHDVKEYIINEYR